MEEGRETAADQVRQLSNSFNKAARAVRQIVVLKHEVAGLRPTPHARAPGPANQNRPATGRHGAARFGHAGRSTDADRDRRDYDDLSDDERDAVEETAEAYLRKLVDALEVDIQAAGPDKVAEAKGASVAMKLSTIAASIPHPTLDKAIADNEMEYLWDIFAPRYAGKREGTGPPG
jgi:hypothetical protein